jgi:hypothetical protein
MSRIQSAGSLPQFGDVPESRGILRNTSRNLSIALDRPQFMKKLPLKALSFQPSFRSSIDGASSSLPEFNDVNTSLSKSQHSKPLTYRASEKGRGDVLPTSSFRKNGYVSDHSWCKNQNQPLSSISSMAQKLRRRTASTEAYMSDSSAHKAQRSRSFGEIHSRKHRDAIVHGGLGLLKLFRRMELMQILIFCTVSLLVYDSYQKLRSTSNQLRQIKNDESMMMLHLQRIERQSIQLRENMARLGEKSGHMAASDSYASSVFSSTSEHDSQIHLETQQLYEMQEELDHALRALQTKLQQAARSSISNTYGDGPVKVVLELDFPDEPFSDSDNSVSILLWYDTPYAAWTWLKQIQSGEWNGSSFAVGEMSSIEAQPTISNAGTLDFVEKSQKDHEAWTVGLTDHEGNLGMFINLKDNSSMRKFDVCVGKVIGGFDALQKIIEGANGDAKRSVKIQRATAVHLSRSQ